MQDKVLRIVLITLTTFTLATLALMNLDPDEASAQEGANYDESKMPVFTLPDPLVMTDGSSVTKAEQWPQRRAEIMKLLAEHVYGTAPDISNYVLFSNNFDAIVELSNGLEGDQEKKIPARRHQATMTLEVGSREIPIHLLMYAPKSDEPAPLFLGLNFRGNHTTTDDPAIPITTSWIPNDKTLGIENNRSNEQTRGSQKSRWPYFSAVSRGYAVATIYCGDIDPDFDDGFENGIHAVEKLEETKRTDTSGGTIAAWAGGMSAARRYLQSYPGVDAERIIAIGHSRLGKTALWAGATDEDFAMVVSNNSGCGGAALSRRRIGESVKRINTVFPHWFNDRFTQYNDNEDAMPIDQHSLIAAIAPRPVYITSASEDRWADPKGEFLSAVHADPVYQLLTGEGLESKEYPANNSPIIGRISYHVREGKHDITPYDWEQFMDAADRMLK